jgi:hypothetical protein
MGFAGGRATTKRRFPSSLRISQGGAIMVINNVSPSDEPANTGDRPVEAATARVAPAYHRPQLTFIGSVTRLVQSGPWGNRYETYVNSYWSSY